MHFTYLKDYEQKEVQMELGRAMLEMIFVLAIGCLVTVGGILYWNNTLIQTHANVIMDEVMKRVAVQKGSALTTNMFDREQKIPYGYGIQKKFSAICKKNIIEVGSVKNSDKPLTEKLCSLLYSRIKQQGWDVYKHGTCEILEKTDCVSASTMDIVFERAKFGRSSSSLIAPSGGEETVVPTPNSSGESPSSCEMSEYFDSKTGSCMPCPFGQSRLVATDNDCVYCYTGVPQKNGLKKNDAGECCNPVLGDWKAEYCQYCRSNQDCESGEYCDVVNPRTGLSRCKHVDGQILYGPYIYKAEALSYEGAKNWCLAQGKKIISVPNDCFDVNTTSWKAELTQTGNCYSSESASDIASHKDGNLGEISPKMAEITKNFTSGQWSFWTDDKRIIWILPISNGGVSAQYPIIIDWSNATIYKEEGLTNEEKQFLPHPLCY